MIQVTIQCTTGKDDIPEALQGIPGIAESQETEFRNGYVMIDKIIGFYPSHDKTHSHIHCVDDQLFSVKESEEEIAEKIRQAKNILIESR